MDLKTICARKSQEYGQAAQNHLQQHWANLGAQAAAREILAEVQQTEAAEAAAAKAEAEKPEAPAFKAVKPK